VAIFVLGLAEMLGVDLEEEINAKMSSNLRRMRQEPRLSTISVSFRWCPRQESNLRHTV
jgi:hypothetical protein